MNENSTIKVGSRKSELALVQTKYVISLLKELHPEKEFEIITMSTLGDKILDIPLPKIGEKSLFTKELETALLDGSVDFVVHSLKDLPTSLPDGMAIGAVLAREDPRDALVLKKDLESHTLSSLPNGSVIGTSSLRRTAQIAKKYPHLKVESIRGNLNTRLKKLDDLEKYHAIVLAAAGLIRIGWKERISKFLDCNDVLYAVGQGALAIECKETNTNIIKLLEPLYDIQTALRVIAERSFLKTLGGGCSAPVAVTSKLKNLNDNEIELTLQGAVWSLDGAIEMKDTDTTKVVVTNNVRCASCPFNNNGLRTEIKDIECLKECVKCPESPLKNRSQVSRQPKRIKLDISKEVLENDPHEKCPIELPIGADFMGKCPFLDGELDQLHQQVTLNGTIEGLTVCPFNKNILRDNKNRVATAMAANNGNEVSSSSSDSNENLFVGLVAHANVSKGNLEKVRELGESLAKRLMAKGAIEVMRTAQDIIHSQTNVTAAIAHVA